MSNLVPAPQDFAQAKRCRRTINLGKYGSFPANSIIGRPYYLTFDVLDKGASPSGLRVVPPAELYADINDEEASSPAEVEIGETKNGAGGVEYDVVGQDGQVVMRTNRQIIDDPNSQILTMDEIEAMKADGTSGKELVDKILKSHSAIDQKTAFALAKYTLRKTKKYLKRFTVLPLDVSTLARWIFYDKEPMKIMDLREEILALISSWSNVHYTPSDLEEPVPEEPGRIGGGRWLVVDETAGLLTAYMAEKIGILNPPRQETTDASPQEQTRGPQTNGEEIEEDQEMQEAPDPSQSKPRTPKYPPPSSTNNIHVIHSASQPNLSLLKYFHFDPFNPAPTHPLTTHLKTLSWLQLLAPSEDAGYTEPELLSPEDLQTMKSGKRGNYFRKRRRWERIKSTVDETRAGGFDGLIVASVMQPVTILRHLVPLLRGGAQVVVYAPTVEPLAELADLYSTGRRTAFISDSPGPEEMPTEDFPIDPTLLLAPMIQTARARSWQVLPGRTHPLMTGRGGSDGFVFTATRVLPAEGKIEARGKFKRRKAGAGIEAVEAVESQQASPAAVEGDAAEAQT